MGFKSRSTENNGRLTCRDDVLRNRQTRKRREEWLNLMEVDEGGGIMKRSFDPDDDTGARGACEP